MNTKRIFTWIAFIVVIGLIIWGLIVAQMKSDQAGANLPLPNGVIATDHVIGTSTAPVTLIEYGDFQCPACGLYFPIVEQTVTEVGTSTVRFVFRHFPLSQHPNAVPAAHASEAASMQGKFWEMYRLLYENQKDWVDSTKAEDIFVGYAQQLGLNVDKFKADMASKEADAPVNADYAGGVKAGINQTPTFYVNGKQIQGPQTVDEFKKIINDAAQSQTNS